MAKNKMEFQTIKMQTLEGSIIDVANEAVGLSIAAETICLHCNAKCSESKGKVSCPKCGMTADTE